MATLADIRRLPRGPQASQDATMEEVMWNDPAEMAGERDTSPRGTGYVFGERLTRRWLAAEGLRYVIRSHQCKSPEGVSVNHSGLVFTVFSASNYYGTLWPSMSSRAFANNGSVLLMDSADPNPTPVSFSWDPILASFDDPETAPFLPLSGSGRGLPYKKVIDFQVRRKYLFPLAVYEHLSEIEALVMHIKLSPEGAERSDDDIFKFAAKRVTGAYMFSEDLSEAISEAISRRDPPWSSWHADIREQFPHDDPSTTTPQALFQHLRAHLTLAQASDAHIHYYISKCYPPSHTPQAPSGLQEPSPEQLARFHNTSRARPLEWHAG
ncbi:Serine/threonine-protein phosphatase 5 [Diplonema papillatum]|nr:Serine/threonine-protein phosphatase 5 [Diplonema papillatum]